MKKGASIARRALSRCRDLKLILADDLNLLLRLFTGHVRLVTNHHVVLSVGRVWKTLQDFVVESRTT